MSSLLIRNNSDSANFSGEKRTGQIQENMPARECREASSTSYSYDNCWSPSNLVNQSCNFNESANSGLAGNALINDNNTIRTISSGSKGRDMKTKTIYICEHCQQAFEYLNPFLRHLQGLCGDLNSKIEAKSTIIMKSSWLVLEETKIMNPNNTETPCLNEVLLFTQKSSCAQSQSQPEVIVSGPEEIMELSNKPVEPVQLSKEFHNEEHENEPQSGIQEVVASYVDKSEISTCHSQPKASATSFAPDQSTTNQPVDFTNQNAAKSQDFASPSSRKRRNQSTLGTTLAGRQMSITHYLKNVNKEAPDFKRTSPMKIMKEKHSNEEFVPSKYMRQVSPAKEQKLYNLRQDPKVSMKMKSAMAIENEDMMRSPKKRKLSDNQKVKNNLSPESENMTNISSKEKCDNCLKEFSTPLSLKYHIKSGICIETVVETKSNVILINEKENNCNSVKAIFPCWFCKKKFSKAGLKYHYKRRVCGRMEKAEAICKYCGKKCSNNRALKLHVRTHTGERPYSCEHCEKTFAYTASLSLHVRTHTGDKPYACKLCGNKYASSSVLKTHMKYHEAGKLETCKFCNQTFLGLMKLADHLREHKGQEKPYWCQFCELKFAAPNVLKSHIRQHTGEKPYVCVKCDKAYANLSSIKYHKKICTV